MKLKDYIETRNLNRKKEYDTFFLDRGYQNLITEQKMAEYDGLIDQMKQFIKKAIGEGNLFVKFKTMLDQFYFKIKREIFHAQNASIVRDSRPSHPGFQQLRKGNDTLRHYFEQCAQQKEEIDNKLKNITPITPITPTKLPPTMSTPALSKTPNIAKTPMHMISEVDESEYKKLQIKKSEIKPPPKLNMVCDFENEKDVFKVKPKSDALYTRRHTSGPAALSSDVSKLNALNFKEELTSLKNLN